MAPIMDIPNEKDYQKMVKIAEAIGVKYSASKTDNKTSEDDFIYVPSINLWVAKERSLFNTKFYDAQKELHSKNQKMLTIPEFREFLKYTKENHKDIYNEITEVRNPWRAEWIDADFKVKRKDLIVNYYVFENGKIVPKSEKLDKNTLMKNKTPGISLEYWLEDSTEQGFPTKETNSGSLYYWAPMKDDNSVARFDAGVDGAGLYCGRGPASRDSFLGVRAVRHE